MTNETVTHEQFETWAEQLQDEDPEDLYALLAVLADDVERTVAEDVSLISPEFQSVYDDVRNEERVIREARSPDFQLTEAVGEYERESVSLALVRGEMDFEDVLSPTELTEADVSDEIRSGKELFKRFGAKFRENVCNDPKTGGSLDRTQLNAVIAAIVLAVLGAAIYAPIAAIIAVLIVNAGLDTYCPDRVPEQ